MVRYECRRSPRESRENSACDNRNADYYPQGPQPSHHPGGRSAGRRKCCAEALLHVPSIVAGQTVPEEDRPRARPDRGTPGHRHRHFIQRHCDLPIPHDQSAAADACTGGYPASGVSRPCQLREESTRAPAPSAAQQPTENPLLPSPESPTPIASPASKKPQCHQGPVHAAPITTLAGNCSAPTSSFLGRASSGQCPIASLIDPGPVAVHATSRPLGRELWLVPHGAHNRGPLGRRRHALAREALVARSSCHAPHRG